MNSFRSNQSQPIYVRVKRHNQTYFIFTSPSNTIYSIKEQISQSLEGRQTDNDVGTTTSPPAAASVSPRKMRLYKPTSTPTAASSSGSSSSSTTTNKKSANTSAAEEVVMLLPNSATLSDHDITNDSILYVTFRKLDAPELNNENGNSNNNNEGRGGGDDDGGWEDVEIFSTTASMTARVDG